MIMNFRNKNNENKNISNIDKGNSASYKKRNEKIIRLRFSFMFNNEEEIYIN
jgi:hypothetical protein